MGCALYPHISLYASSGPCALFPGKKTEIQGAQEPTFGNGASEEQSWNVNCNLSHSKVQAAGHAVTHLYSKTFLDDLFLCPFHKYLLSTCYAHDMILICKGDTKDIEDTGICLWLLIQICDVKRSVCTLVGALAHPKGSGQNTSQLFIAISIS